MKDYLQIPNSSPMKCFLPIHPLFVLICHLGFAGTDFVIHDHLHRVSRPFIPSLHHYLANGHRGD